MRLAALILAILLAACSERPREPDALPVPVASLAGGEAGRIAFATREPYDFPDLRTGQAVAGVIEGRLVLPPGEGPVRGAALLSHGAGGTGGRQDRMADWLAERGYAAFVLDHFGPRGIGSTARDQLRATEQTMVADLFAARDLLASHPRIPADRIGVIGWSKGGTTAVLAAVDRVAGYAAGEDGPRLAFAAAFYPFCGFALGGEPLATPLLMLLGEADDWTPAAPCAGLAEAWAARGQPAEAVVYPGAPHGFDSGAWFDISIGRAIAVRDTGPTCTLALGPDGRTVTLEGGGRLDSLDGRRAFLARCGERGVTFGGDGDAARDAYERIEAFLGAALP